ncbi:hypothetical protein [Hyalangium gracile]|uniref:hypothetical protein n=1 Tax=Hyalangium gracile TaxID=394092 RepID=UPI001CCC4FD8|nr:hypothetical protein [Hyalangium gracile]
MEDSPLDAEFICAQLEEAGARLALTRVDSHAGFNEALSECRFDLILSDCHRAGRNPVHHAAPEEPATRKEALGAIE